MSDACFCARQRSPYLLPVGRMIVRKMIRKEDALKQPPLENMRARQMIKKRLKALTQ